MTRSFNSYILIAVLFSACGTKSEQYNTLSEAEKAEGWQLLFDGRSLEGWHLYNKGGAASKWTVADGELLCDPKKPNGVFGDLVTDRSFEDFELRLEWKVSKGGNSGVFVNVREDTAYAAVFATGLEMQLLDNTNAEPRHQADSTHWAGCLYGVDCLGQNSQPNPHGEWNESRVVQQNGKLSFWLNGKPTFEQDIRTEAFGQLVENSTMKVYPDFAKFPSGKIALQNHTDSVAFRNIKIREN